MRLHKIRSLLDILRSMSAHFSQMFLYFYTFKNLKNSYMTTVYINISGFLSSGQMVLIQEALKYMRNREKIISNILK